VKGQYRSYWKAIGDEGEKFRPKLRRIDDVDFEIKECGFKKMEKKSLYRTE
jgi:hypothetical protein